MLSIYRNKRVLLTGHTGFKGSWLTAWLHQLGAEVYGLSLVPENKKWLFVQGKLEECCHHTVGDIRDLALVKKVVNRVKPAVIFHLAAQPIVRASYTDPVGTSATNIMGSIHLMEAVRLLGRPCAVVMVTSDKCYENREWSYAYRENDPMGGHDVYSMSKGAAELTISAYRRSFFPPEGSIAMASGRAGNVIGPGDWAKDRIVADAMRTLLDGETLVVRNPSATRPWQHVLEPLSGYLTLGAMLMGGKNEWVRDGWNFGPGLDAARTVGELADEMIKVLGRGTWTTDKKGKHPHEANFLRLSIEKASNLLGWNPVWNFDETVKRTVKGYQALVAAGKSHREVRSFMEQEIQAYAGDASAAGCAWARKS